MSEQIFSGLIGGVSGAITSGIIYWMLDKRREKNDKRKYSQARSDAITFIKSIPDFQEDYDLIDKHIDNLGSYRLQRIEPLLKNLEIMAFVTSSNSFSKLLKPQFKKLTPEDIKVIVKDIKKGFYDTVWE